MTGDPAALTPGAGFHLQADGGWAVEEIPQQVLNEAKFSGYLTIQGYRCTVFDTPGNDSWAQKSANVTTTASKARRASVDTEVFVSITHPPGMPQGVAVERAKELVPCEVGEFSLEQAEDTWMVGNLGMELDFYEQAGGYSKYGPDDAGVTVEWENPAGAAEEDEDQMQQQASVPPLARRVAARYVRAQQELVTQLKEGLEKDDMAAWNKAAQEFAGKVKEWLPDLDVAHTDAVDGLEKAVGKLPKAGHPRVDAYEAQQLQGVFQEYLEAVRAAKQAFDERIMQALQELLPSEGEGEAQTASGPGRVAAELRAIADRIDRSASPRADLVAADVRRLMASLG